MASTRNLTQQFVRYRNEAKRARRPEAYGDERLDDHATSKLLGAALGSSDIEMGPAGIGAAYAPSWVGRSERIRADMTQLKERLGRLKEFHSKALLVTFDSEASPASHVDVLTREVRLQVQRQLAQALFKLSVEFRKEETRYLNKMEAQKGLAQGSSIGLIEDDAAGPGGGGGWADPGFTEAQLQKARRGALRTLRAAHCALRGAAAAADARAAPPAGRAARRGAQVSQAEALIEERDEEIRKIVETIAELGQIMRDLSTLVVEQGSMLDRIDANGPTRRAGAAPPQVEEGVKELVRAEKTQRAGRAALCIIFLLCMIALLLVIAIVRHI
ncbi:SYP43 [Scenedesmus sp. PABB004]|nr:SYP43 [Scenedesmus sp. PABB004]